MAASRKLQGEIDRCLKKVTEGVETFEDIWTKVTHATNSNQKEKYEADLKKEIKKLQRLRDQIKTWQASAEVKDKSSLVEHRKLIETQMERFKGLERETKTKAYSKEGLGAATKLDPVQKERDDCTRWLSVNIEQLNVQIDQFEAEMDGLTAKRKRDKDKTERVDTLKHWIERHRFHIKKLETLLRMLDNNAVDIDSVKKIRDDVEYYTESNQEDDFTENEYIYSDINMDNMEEMFVADVGVTDTRGDESETPTPSLHSGSSPSPLNNHSTTAIDNHANDDTSNKRTRRSVSEDSSSTQKSKHSSGTSKTQSSSNVPKAAAVSSSAAPSATISRSQSAQLPSAGSSSVAVPLATSHVITPTADFASVAAAAQQPTAASVHILTTTPSSAVSSAGVTASVTAATAPGAATVAAPSASTGAAPLPPPSAPSPTAPPSLVNSRQNTASTPLPAQVQPSTQQQQQQTSQPQPSVPALQQVNGEKTVDVNSIKALAHHLERTALNSSPADVNKAPPPTNEAKIPVLYSVAPLGPVPMTKEHEHQFQMLQAAFYHMPHPSDSERLRTYLPRQPYPTPPYYPQAPPPASDSIEFFLKLSVETLFFIFYYMEGTKAQYLAAKALKKQSWRFHTKYMMWFQRHEEPKVITDEYEQGTYVYFDFEKWSQRKKEGFKFEYKFLEDRDLN